MGGTGLIRTCQPKAYLLLLLQRPLPLLPRPYYPSHYYLLTQPHKGCHMKSCQKCILPPITLGHFLGDPPPQLIGWSLFVCTVSIDPFKENERCILLIAL